MSAFITGIEDEKSSDVSLTALRGLALVIVHLPKGVVENSIDLVSLKVMVIPLTIKNKLSC